MQRSRIIASLRAGAVHLGLSAVVALLAAALILNVWFPHPHRDLTGGIQLFWILVMVDVVCGPLLTAVLFNPAKSRRELVLDMSLVAFLQLAALVYGLYTANAARPVAMVFEVDRFVVVTRPDVDPDDMDQAPPQYRHLSLLQGPRLLGSRAPRDGNEMLESVDLSIAGKEPSLRPGWWQPYEQNRQDVRQRMKPLAELYAAQPPTNRQVIDAALQNIAVAKEGLFYLPLVHRKLLDSWIVLLDSNADIRGYAPVGGF